MKVKSVKKNSLSLRQKPKASVVKRPKLSESKNRTGESKSRALPPDQSPNIHKNAFPIVGIGASAGGLEALEQFLAHVPPRCGLAFVIVQHLDPTHKDLMVELLQRVTPMKVLQIKDRLKVKADHVYVIPPNQDLAIMHGVLHLLEPAAVRGLRLPIDSFFRSLAEDQQENSIGLVLSGMGSDGTLGLRAIKEKAGVAFVQASPKFDGMPKSAVEAGLADVIAPAEELAGKIVAFLQHVPILSVSSIANPTETDQSGLEKIVMLLRAKTGHDFSLYKKNTIYRRIERRMGLHQISKIAGYVRYLRENPSELELLFKELLIGVTSFFRDASVWAQLKTEVVPALLASRPNGGTLRAWVAACSTGEEAYSLAIIFKEALELLRPNAHYSLQVFATDLDKEAIATARTGSYLANIAIDVGQTLLRRYFVQEGQGFRVSKEIREMVIFAPQNLVMDPPFTKLDIVACRNLLIYLEGDLQKKLLPLFYYSLNSDGILILGKSETVGDHSELFDSLPGKTRLYRRKEGALQKNLVEFPNAFHRSLGYSGKNVLPLLPPAPALNLQALTDSLLLERYSPAAVLTTEKGDIVYISGKTGRFLEPAVGKANLNIFAMAREGLSAVLNETFGRVVREKGEITIRDVTVGSNGGSFTVDVVIRPLVEPDALQGLVLIVFTDVPTPLAAAPGKGVRDKIKGARMVALANELQEVREAQHVNRQEMQSSQEELKSTNEELQSTNEELQSANEELSTSKEEMESLNEELQTVNNELQAKVDELSWVSDDMKYLLNSTDIATLFLDNELKVRRFTSQTTAIIKLIPGDAGRPITDLVTAMNYPDLAEDSQEVLETLVIREREVSTRDGRWFTVRIMPYRTKDNRIDGVVITFVDISVAKALEATLRKALSVLQGRFTDQNKRLDEAKTLETVLKKAQVVLQNRLSVQAKSILKTRLEGNPPKRSAK